MRTDVGFAKYKFIYGIVLVLCIYCIGITDHVRDTYYCSKELDVSGAPVIQFQSLEQSFHVSDGRLDSLEFMFADIPEHKEGTLLLHVESEGKVLYTTNITMAKLEAGIWYRQVVNIPVRSGCQYRMKLSLGENTLSPSVYLLDAMQAAPETGECEIDGLKQNGSFAVKYGYQRAFQMTDKILAGVFAALFLLVIETGISYLQKHWQKIKKKLWNIWDTYGYLPFLFMEMVLCGIIIESSGIAFHISVKAVFYLLSAWSVFQLQCKVKAVFSRMQSFSQRLLFVCLVLYTGFALVGNRLFVYPLNKKVLLADWTVYGVTCCWLVPILITGIYQCFQITMCSPRKIEKRDQWKIGIVAGAILLVSAGITLYAFNPAITSPDTAYCLQYAHHLKGVQDWHPPAYIMILKALIQVWDSTYGIVFAQWFFWIYVNVEMLLFLQERGWKYSRLVCIAVVAALNCGNALHICTIWKDIPYTLALVWLTVLFAKLSVKPDFYKRKKYIYLELTVALFLTGMMRQNGIVPYIVTVCVIFLCFRSNRRMVISASVSILLIAVIKGPVYQYIDVQPAAEGGKYVGLSQDILGVYYAGGDVSEDTLEMIAVLTGNNMGEFDFSPYYATCSQELDVPVFRFIRNYMDTFVHNPVVMIREILCRQDVAWGIFDGQDAFEPQVNSHGTVEEDPNWQEMWETYYPKRKENAVTARLSDTTLYSSQNQLLRILEWRAGFWMVLLLFSSLILFLKKGWRIFSVYVPVAGHVLSLLLSTGWSDFRYYWGINLIAFFICLFVLTVTGSIDCGQEHRG